MVNGRELLVRRGLITGTVCIGVFFGVAIVKHFIPKGLRKKDLSKLTQEERDFIEEDVVEVNDKDFLE